MRGLVRSVPTFKWLLVLPQLTSRLCHAQPDVQALMAQLLGLIVEHFPQQALWAMAAVQKSTVRARQVRQCLGSAVLCCGLTPRHSLSRSHFVVVALSCHHTLLPCAHAPPARPQEAASAILLSAKRSVIARRGEAGSRLFDSFTRLSDQLIRTCMWQPPPDRRMSK